MRTAAFLIAVLVAGCSSGPSTLELESVPLADFMAEEKGDFMPALVTALANEGVAERTKFRILVCRARYDGYKATYRVKLDGSLKIVGGMGFLRTKDGATREALLMFSSVTGPGGPREEKVKLAVPHRIGDATHYVLLIMRVTGEEFPAGPRVILERE